MDKKVDYKRVMDLGSWLDRYINPDLSAWDIEDLVDDALKLLNIDHVRSYDDPLVNAMIDLMKEHDLRHDYKKHEATWLNDTVQRFTEALREGGTLADYSADSQDQLVFDIQMSIIYFQGILDDIGELQKHKDTPWENLLLTSARSYPHKKSKEPFLLEEYNNIRERLVIKNRKLAVVHKMVYHDTNIKAEWVRFPAMVSRIFINFLREGGRDYCGVCKNCGKFILAERKGQRQFCDGRCRIAYKRMRDKMAHNGN